MSSRIVAVPNTIAPGVVANQHHEIRRRHRRVVDDTLHDEGAPRLGRYPRVHDSPGIPGSRESLYRGADALTGPYRISAAANTQKHAGSWCGQGQIRCSEDYARASDPCGGYKKRVAGPHRSVHGEECRLAGPRPGQLQWPAGDETRDLRAARRRRNCSAQRR
jgi:hypothetical protein